MSDLALFQFGGQQMRIEILDGEPWFVAADIARILGYRDAHNMVRRLDPDERGTRVTSTPSGDQEMVVISEPGLYAAVLGSQIAGARAFQRWVRHEVLASIRRTGSYGTAPAAVTPPTRLELAQMVVAAEAEIAAQNEIIAEMEPKVHFVDMLMSADGDWSVRDAAQMLNRDPSISTGQRRLFATLRELKWLDRKGTPYQAQIENGRLSTRVQTYDHPHTGEPTLGAPQIRITSKGLTFVHRHLGGTAQLALIVNSGELSQP